MFEDLSYKAAVSSARGAKKVETYLKQYVEAERGEPARLAV